MKSDLINMKQICIEQSQMSLGEYTNIILFHDLN